MFFTFTFILVCLAPALCWPVADKPMVCPATHERKTYELNNDLDCPKLFESPQKTLPKFRASVYRRNNAKHVSEAHHCWRVRSDNPSYTGFWWIEPRCYSVTFKPQEVSADECRNWIEAGEAADGTLEIGLERRSGGTTNKGYCKSYGSQARNYGKDCHVYTFNSYFVKGKISISFQTEGIMESTFGDMSHCMYDEKNCRLRDGSRVIWQTDSKAKCKYEFWKNLELLQTDDNVLVSLDEALAFRRPKFQPWDAPDITDCGNELIKTSQDYAIGALVPDGYVLVSQGTPPTEVARQSIK